jgi:fibronectin-binding autotransporter adhesin
VGTTTVNQGAVSLQKATSGTIAIGGDLTFNNNLSPDVYTIGADNQFAPGAVVSFITDTGDHGRLELMGTTQTVAGIQTVGYTGQRGVIQNREMGPVNLSTSTLILNGSGSYSFGGYLRNSTGMLALTYSGSGTQTLTGPQITHTGLTTVTSGTLVLNGTSGWNSNIVNTGTVELAAPTATWTIGSGETFSGSGTYNKTGGFITKISNHVIQATGSINIQGGTLQNDGNACNWTATTADMSIGATGILDLFADAVYVDALTGSGFVQNGYGNTAGSQSGNAAFIEKLVVGTNNAGSAEFTGVIRDNATNAVPAAATAGGGVAIEKTGTGLQKLTGVSVYTGATTVTGGTLQAGVASVANVSGAFGKNSPVSVANTAGAILDLNNLNTQIGSLTGGGTTGGTVAMGTATLTTGGANLSSPAPFAGVISGTGNLVKIGTGTQSLSGLNTFNGYIQIDGGVLSATVFNPGGDPGPLGTAANDPSNLIINGATLQYEGTTNSTSDREYTVTELGGALSATGTGAVTMTASPSWDGTESARTFGLTGTSTALNTLTGAITDDGVGATSVTKTGTGTWQLGGTAASTYTGLTTVDNGTLILGKTGGAKAIVGPVTMGGGNTNQPNLRMAVNEQFGPGLVLNFVNAAGNWMRFDLQGTTQTLEGIQCTTGGGIVQNDKTGGGGTTSAATLIINNTADYSFNGYMRNGGAGADLYALNLVKNGTGTQTLTGTNITFGGDLTINGGKLNGTGFGAKVNTRTITVNATGTLEMLAGNVFGGHNATTAPTLVINSGGTVTNASPATNNALYNVTLNGGTLTSTIGSPDTLDRGYETYAAWGINGTVTSSGTSTITTTAASDGEVLLNSSGTDTTFNVTDGTLTVSTALIDGERGTVPSGYATNLIKDGDGTLALTKSNTYTGNTTVNAGTLELADNAQLKFIIGATDGVNNALTGAGTATLNGDFVIDTTLAASLTSGTWVLEDVTTLTGGAYGSSFTVVDFVNAGGDMWTKDAGGGKTWTFDEGTGTLTLVESAGYDSWALQIADEGQRGRTQDPDNDGFTNLQEFLFGSDPEVANGALTTTEKTNDGLVIRWSERTTGATYSLLESATLANPWTEWVEGSAPYIIETDGAQDDQSPYGIYQPMKATVEIDAGKNFFRVEGVETN